MASPYRSQSVVEFVRVSPVNNLSKIDRYPLFIQWHEEHEEAGGRGRHTQKNSIAGLDRDYADSLDHFRHGQVILLGEHVIDRYNHIIGKQSWQKPGTKIMAFKDHWSLVGETQPLNNDQFFRISYVEISANTRRKIHRMCMFEAKQHGRWFSTCSESLVRETSLVSLK